MPATASGGSAEYCEHLPLYRQSEIFARQGVELSRALLSNWGDACCQLMTPLNDALYRYVMNTRKLHTDDTPVKVLAPGLKKTKTGRIWTYVRGDLNAGSSSPPAVWFAYSPIRQGKHPELSKDIVPAMKIHTCAKKISQTTHTKTYKTAYIY